MWRTYRRRRGTFLAMLAAGTCFQAVNCLQEAQLTGIRIGFSSLTLPYNQWLIGIVGFANALITNAIASLITGS